MTELIFTYGFPASGKTTYAKALVAANPNYIYLAADDVRRELYGSQDYFGNPEDIYTVLLSRMMKHLRQGHSVVYDACNLYRQFRMDYLTPIEEAGIQCYKTLVRLNTTRETCLLNHAGRGRNFDIEKLSHYFEINEFPRMDEGWDYIYDVPDHRLPSKKLYLASPFFGENERRAAIDVCEHFRSRGHSVVLPLEHKFPNAYDMSNPDWGRAVFEYDIQAIQSADFVVCLSYGRQSTAGTNWEAGYAHGIGKPVLVVEMPGVKLMSLMLMNGCHAVFRSIEELKKYDLNIPVRVMDMEMEQK